MKRKASAGSAAYLCCRYGIRQVCGCHSRLFCHGYRESAIGPGRANVGSDGESLETSGGVAGLAVPALLLLTLRDTFPQIAFSGRQPNRKWITSHTLRPLYAYDRASLRHGSSLLQMDLFQAAARSVACVLALIGPEKSRGMDVGGDGGHSVTAGTPDRLDDRARDQ